MNVENLFSCDVAACSRELPSEDVVETMCTIAQQYRAETGPARRRR